MNESLLLVEDDDTIRLTLAEFLAKRGYRVDAIASCAAALDSVRRQRYALVLLDLRLPDGNGVDLLPQILAADEQALVVMMTAFPEVRSAVDALKAGAYDYLNKPFDLLELLQLIGRALETRHLRREIAWRRAQQGSASANAMIGDSPAFRRMLDLTRRVAQVDAVPVLILGETGSGKERIARAVHEWSPRRDGPWITVNCSALAQGLLESEMFGHEKGAFTDAKSGKPGLFELADGGTLFLDEIGDLSPALQPKLLRVLDAGTFRRVGGCKELRVDVRIVAATHRDLRQMVGRGEFREDLYFRLNVGMIAVPPLRERQADIPALAGHFLRNMAAQAGVETAGIGEHALQAMRGYSWPGNVRELRNVIERALLLGGRPIDVGDLPSEIRAQPALPCTPTADGAHEGSSLAAMERAHILHTLENCGGNRSKAAERLGISRPTLRSKLRDYGSDTTA